MSRHIHLGDLLRKCKQMNHIVQQLRDMVDEMVNELTFEDENQNNNS